VFIVVFSFAPVPNLNPEDRQSPLSADENQSPLFNEKHFIFGWISQFLYVAAQCGIFAFFITYILDRNHTPALSERVAASLPADMCQHGAGGWFISKGCSPYMLSLAFLLFAIGRFSGSAIQSRCAPHRVLGIYGVINILLMLLVIANFGWFSVIALILSFFFMSIMYPTNFALGIRGLGGRTKLAASFMVTAIIGGAVMPWCMGLVIDHYGWSGGFIMPLVCFMFIAFYGFTWRKWYAHDDTGHAGSTVPAGH
jgi:MFS transporter, FHS family, L-fucose permease